MKKEVKKKDTRFAADTAWREIPEGYEKSTMMSQGGPFMKDGSEL